MNASRKKADPAEDAWMSLSKAAAAIGRSRQGVLAAVARGELRAATVAERIVISREDVARIQAEAAQSAA